MIESGNHLSPLTRERLEPSLFVNRALLRRMQAHEDETLKVAQLAVAQVKGQCEAASSDGGGTNDAHKRGVEETGSSNDEASSKRLRVA